MEDTLKAFADACNWINQNTPANLRNKVRIQGIVYQDVRAKFGLSANLAIRAINRVASNRKTAMKDHSSVKNFEPTSIDYDTRIFAFREKDEEISVTLLRSRQRIKLVLGDYQRTRLKDSKPTSATLCKKGSEYYINIQVKSEAPERIHVDTVLGVDLGITDIAVTTEGQKFGGKTIKLIKNHYVYACCSSTESRERYKEFKAKMPRASATTIRQRSTLPTADQPRNQQSHCDQSPGDSCQNCSGRHLTGIREGVNQKSRKNHRRRVNGWASYQLKEFLSYKALAAGVPLVLVDPAYTSQMPSVVSMESGMARASSVMCVVGLAMLISMVLRI